MKVAARMSTLRGLRTSDDEAAIRRNRMFSARKSVPIVVMTSVVNINCNAWTTTGRFSGPTAVCPFGCGAPLGDSLAHFLGCHNFRSMWRMCAHQRVQFCCISHWKMCYSSPKTCPAMRFLSLPCGLMLWGTAHDIKARAVLPCRMEVAGPRMIEARLRYLAVQSASTRSVIRGMRVVHGVAEE